MRTIVFVYDPVSGMYVADFVAGGVNSIELNRDQNGSIDIMRRLPGGFAWHNTLTLNEEVAPKNLLSLLSWYGETMEWRIISSSPVRGLIKEVTK